jgi:hypothetical protein
MYIPILFITFLSFTLITSYPIPAHIQAQIDSEDPLAQVRSVIGYENQYINSHSNSHSTSTSTSTSYSSLPTSFVETSAQVGKVHSFCEICILIMQMKERGQPHLCAGLNKNYEITVNNKYIYKLIN